MSDRFTGAAGILEQVNGTWTYLGTITGAIGANTTNATTAVAFTLVPGKRLVLQTDTAVQVLPMPQTRGAAAVAVTAANGFTIPALGTQQTCLQGFQSTLSVFGVAAYNVKVFSLD
jgi:hypothetical protein